MKRVTDASKIFNVAAKEFGTLRAEGTKNCLTSTATFRPWCWDPEVENRTPQQHHQHFFQTFCLKRSSLNRNRKRFASKRFCNLHAPYFCEPFNGIDAFKQKRILSTRTPRRRIRMSPFFSSVLDFSTEASWKKLSPVDDLQKNFNDFHFLQILQQNVLAFRCRLFDSPKLRFTLPSVANANNASAVSRPVASVSLSTCFSQS